MNLGDVRLDLPGSTLKMRIAPDSEIDSPALFAQGPIVVIHGTAGPSITFDATALRAVYGERARAIEAILEHVDPGEIGGSLGAHALADAIEPLAVAEARLLEGPDPAALAIVVLVHLQARIASL